MFYHFFYFIFLLFLKVKFATVEMREILIVAYI